MILAPVGQSDFYGLVAAFAELCNQIRSHGVWFGKRAVVGAVRVFESYLGLRFCFYEEALSHKEAQEAQDNR